MTHQSTTAYPEFTMKKQIVSELRLFAWHKSCHTATSGISAYSRSILNIEKSQLCDLINTGGTKTIRRYQEISGDDTECPNLLNPHSHWLSQQQLHLAPQNIQCRSFPLNFGCIN